MTYLSMKEISHSLPRDLFIRIHRSFIVTLMFVRVIERNRIELDNGQELILGDYYKQQFLDMMDNHLLNLGKAS